MKLSRITIQYLLLLMMDKFVELFGMVFDRYWPELTTANKLVISFEEKQKCRTILENYYMLKSQLTDDNFFIALWRQDISRNAQNRDQECGQNEIEIVEQGSALKLKHHLES